MKSKVSNARRRNFSEVREVGGRTNFNDFPDSHDSAIVSARPNRSSIFGISSFLGKQSPLFEDMAGAAAATIPGWEGFARREALETWFSACAMDGASF
jgi:hypothetical protein